MVRYYAELKNGEWVGVFANEPADVVPTIISERKKHKVIALYTVTEAQKANKRARKYRSGAYSSSERVYPIYLFTDTERAKAKKRVTVLKEQLKRKN